MDNPTVDPAEQPPQVVSGPILCLDLGRKRVGVAISDPTLVAITTIEAINRSSWKRLLDEVRQLIRHFDAKTLVIGFPLRLDGNEGSAATDARTIASNLSKSLDIPIYLQDERLTSFAAEENLRSQGYNSEEIKDRVDSEAAAIILRDFLTPGQQRRLVRRPSL